MKRELKKGFTFHLVNGDAIRRTYDHEEPDGESKTRRWSKSQNEWFLRADPLIEVDDGMFAENKIKFVPTAEEKTEMANHVQRRKKLDSEVERQHSRAYFAQMVESMTEGEKKVLLETLGLETPENKMLEPAEVKGGCPDCGGKKKGKGFVHADDCPRKK